MKFKRVSSSGFFYVGMEYYSTSNHSRDLPPNKVVAIQAGLDGDEIYGHWKGSKEISLMARDDKMHRERALPIEAATECEDWS